MAEPADPGLLPTWIEAGEQTQRVLNGVLDTLRQVAEGGGGADVAAAPTLAAERPLARLEPSSGIYFGASLDWSHDSVTAYAERLGHPAEVYVAFTHFPVEDTDGTYLDSYIDPAAGTARDGIAHG